MRAEGDEGTTGVVASIVTFLTGAAAETGFHGIGPARRFARRDLLRCGSDVDGIMALRRRDIGAGVMVHIDAGRCRLLPRWRR